MRQSQLSQTSSPRDFSFWNIEEFLKTGGTGEVMDAIKELCTKQLSRGTRTRQIREQRD